jgi:hypothetical protein
VEVHSVDPVPQICVTHELGQAPSLPRHDAWSNDAIYDRALVLEPFMVVYGPTVPIHSCPNFSRNVGAISYKLLQSLTLISPPDHRIRIGIVIWDLGSMLVISNSLRFVQEFEVLLPMLSLRSLVDRILIHLILAHQFRVEVFTVGVLIGPLLQSELI